ncbi:hypothetical protein [Parvicella tangerina]|uniref:Uncharacterized protein n=1 Tax=Parvicella tangerina TaxID=2829795 RepID=A0A916NEX0_9FLAO|nr:hypothetical protein [Parvicella tangerina]CAG5077232.1 hypothetical protein CRYO30217_00326 [Parvicella tangerina]
MPFNKLDDTPAGKIRPRFRLKTSLSKEEIMMIIHQHGEADETVVNSKYDRFIKLTIPKKDRHYWTPVLSLSFDQEEDGTLIRGLIGPNDKVWTMFNFFYFATGVLGTIGSIFALVQWQLYDTWAYIFILPLTVAILSTIFYTARFGKTKAHTQMLHLLRFLRKAVDETDCVRVELDQVSS